MHPIVQLEILETPAKFLMHSVSLLQILDPPGKLLRILHKPYYSES